MFLPSEAFDRILSLRAMGTDATTRRASVVRRERKFWSNGFYQANRSEGVQAYFPVLDHEGRQTGLCERLRAKRLATFSTRRQVADDLD